MFAIAFSSLLFTALKRLSLASVAVGKAGCPDTCADAGKGALVDQIASTAIEAIPARLGVRHARKRKLSVVITCRFMIYSPRSKLSVSTATVAPATMKAAASALET